MWYNLLLKNNLIPDFVIRKEIQRQNRGRLRREYFGGIDTMQEKFNAFLKSIKKSPIAIETQKANEQHYELPSEFFQLVLGKKLKYSSCYYPSQNETLDEAEEMMLEMTLKRADLFDGQKILELGCGWGSLTLLMAKRFPKAKITALSNSISQKNFINKIAQKENIKNIEIITDDINNFNSRKKFDRIVSVEMFEHIRGYEKLFEKLHSWLLPGGKLFVHIFAHKAFGYFFDVKSSSDWMPRFFFSGGIMPSNHTLLYFSKNFKLEEHWVINGRHYKQTANNWLENQDSHKKEIMKIFKTVYGSDDKLWFAYWRIFFMAVAELFATKKGNEWCVNHYRFVRH